MKKTLLSITSLLLLTAISIAQSLVTTNPQFKSAVLEEYTGIHCGYCPDGHLIATTMKNLNPNRIVLINIHEGSYAVPGTNEPDYRTTWGPALDNQAGVTGYPAGTVNRHVFSGLGQTPGGTATGRGTWVSMANDIMLEVSPVNIGASSVYNSTSNELTIDVEAYYTSNSNTATNYINVVLTQDSLLGPQSGGTTHNPTNYVGSDYVHSHMLRDMISGQWGDVISSTTSGSLYTNQYIYTLPTDVNGNTVDIANCHIAVFITETQQEILNGVSILADGGSTDGNNATFIGNFSGLASQALSGTIGSTSSFSFSIDPLVSGTNDFIFELTSDHPNDWTSGYSVDGTPYTGVQTISLTNGTAANINIDVDPGATPSVSSYTLIVTMASDSNAVQTQKVYVISGVTDLVVNGSGSDGAGNGTGASAYEDKYTDGLISAGNTSFDATEADVMNILANSSALTSVNNIYYNVSWTFPSLADEDASTLETFLDNGGNLFISGQDMGWDIESGSGYGTAITQSFYSNYLNASYVDDGNTANSQYTAVNTDFVFGGISSSSITDPYGGYMYPDQISPINGADAILNYNGNASKIGAIKFEDSTYKVVYLGSSLEMVSDNVVRDEIIKISHDWFYGLLNSDNEINFNNIISIYPNPTNDYLNLNSEKEIISYSVINILGEVITKNEGSNIKMIDVSFLENGNYTIILDTKNNSKTLKFTKVK
jgi:hypothetical protein